MAIILVGVVGAMSGVFLVDKAEEERSRKLLEERVVGHGQGDSSRGWWKSIVPGRRGLAEGNGKGHRLGEAEIAEQLPEMMDIIGLAMDGGMSFESAFAAYVKGFDGSLARFCRPYSEVLSSVVEPRDRVLREMSEAVNDKLFTRFADSVIRSMRFGSSLSPTLTRLSEQSRAAYRAKVEERIQKAPTKMLFPTGMLILPAMMILVAGPFLIEIMGQL
ncbi:MAG: type II secretion system F family protein [Coriobacteriales bacterium]